MKQQINEWTDESFKDQPKRWTKNYNLLDGTGLTDFEKLNKKEIDFSARMKRFRTKNMKWG
jgi:hypothetical protein